MRQPRLTAFALLLLGGCTPTVLPSDGGTRRPPTDTHATAVHVFLARDGADWALSDAVLSRRAVPAATETAGDIEVLDSEGNVLAAAPLPEPEPMMVQPEPGQLDGLAAIPERETVEIVLPWTPGRSTSVRFGSTVIEQPRGGAQGLKADGRDAEPIALHRSGPNEARADIVIMAEGFTQRELGLFRQQAQEVADTLLATAPFRTHRSLLNIWAVPVESTRSGLTTEEGGVETAFACWYGCVGADNQPRGLCCNDERVYEQAQAVPSADAIMLLVNSDRRVGTASHYARTANFGEDWREVAVHELGHVLTLGDEYNYGIELPSRRSPAPNCARAASRETGWEHWEAHAHPEHPVGRHDVCGYTDLVRPTEQGCLMRRADHGEFCPVCREVVLNRLLELAGGMPAEASPSRHEPVLSPPEGVTVAVDTGTIPADVAWFVDGEPVAAEGASLTVEGCHAARSVAARVRDGSGFLRPDPSDTLVTGSGQARLLLWSVGPGEGCAPAQASEDGWVRIPHVLETAHPHEEGFLSWSLRGPAQAIEVRPHFALLDVSAGIDIAAPGADDVADSLFFDGATWNVLSQPVDGSRVEMTSEAIDGYPTWGFFVDSLYVRLEPAHEPMRPSEWNEEPRAIASPHPYEHGMEEIYELAVPGAEHLRIHFTHISTEAGYDYVYVWDGAADEVASFDGEHDDLWVEVEGDTAHIVLSTDASVDGFGFEIDRIRWR